MVLTGDALVAAARGMAFAAHAGQTDKAGNRYISHPGRVAHRVAEMTGQNPEAVAVAWLHDVVEDHLDALLPSRDHAMGYMVEVGFPPDVIVAVLALSRQPGETHPEAVRRAAGDRLAGIVKWADVDDNANPARLQALSVVDRDRLRRKYDVAREILREHGLP